MTEELPSLSLIGEEPVPGTEKIPVPTFFFQNLLSPPSYLCLLRKPCRDGRVLGHLVRETQWRTRRKDYVGTREGKPLGDAKPEESVGCRRGL